MPSICRMQSPTKICPVCAAGPPSAISTTLIAQSFEHGECGCEGVFFFSFTLHNISPGHLKTLIHLIAALGLHDLDADATLLLILHVQSALSEWAYHAFHAFPTYRTHRPLLPLITHTRIYIPSRKEQHINTQKLKKGEPDLVVARVRRVVGHVIRVLSLFRSSRTSRFITSRLHRDLLQKKKWKTRTTAKRKQPTRQDGEAQDCKEGNEEGSAKGHGQLRLYILPPRRLHQNHLVSVSISHACNC
jgi:hypothetical protein